MILDGIINFVIWLYQNTLLKLLPENLPFFSYQNFNESLISVKANLIVPLSAINNLFPIDTLLFMVLAILSAELILFGVKLSMYVINLIRGSGA